MKYVPNSQPLSLRVYPCYDNGRLLLTWMLCITQAWSGLEKAISLKQRAFKYLCQKRGKPFVPVAFIMKIKRRYDNKDVWIISISVLPIKQVYITVFFLCNSPSPKPTNQF